MPGNSDHDPASNDDAARGHDALPELDLVIAGGGLAGGLIALALATHRPDIRFVLIENGERLGGNHVWSFFDSDIAPEHRALVAPLISHSWPGYDVAFPGHRRSLEARYNSIESEHFDAHVRQAIGEERIVRGEAVDVMQQRVVMANQQVIRAGGVIDARGGGAAEHLKLGWQKFVGIELLLDAPHGLTRPVVMDATVEQIDGYRFVYCLPFDAHRVFVEDTYYSDSTALDTAAIEARIHDYAGARGWHATGTGRRETGVLPVAHGGDFEAYWQASGGDVAKAGMRGALFHPLTGFSLPDAVRVAHLVAGARDLSGPALGRLLHDHAHTVWQARSHYRMLTTMLFKAAAPEERFRVFERFYTLPPGLIERFYAAQPTLYDKVRILLGRPPVSIARAVRALREHAW